MGAVVAFGELRAVTHEVFDEAAGGVVEAADADESAGAADDFAADDLAVAAAEGVDDAAVGDGLPEKGAELFQRGRVGLAGAHKQAGGGGEVIIGDGGHGSAGEGESDGAKQITAPTARVWR